MPPRVDQTPERHTLSVLVDNEAGVLARIVGLFSGRGYNIDSLTVAEVDTGEHTSRITIVTTGTPMIIEQITRAARAPRARAQGRRSDAKGRPASSARWR